MSFSVVLLALAVLSAGVCVGEGLVRIAKAIERAQPVRDGRDVDETLKVRKGGK